MMGSIEEVGLAELYRRKNAEMNTIEIAEEKLIISALFCVIFPR
jgi:hypothetical protein